MYEDSEGIWEEQEASNDGGAIIGQMNYLLFYLLFWVLLYIIFCFIILI